MSDYCHCWGMASAVLVDRRRLFFHPCRNGNVRESEKAMEIGEENKWSLSHQASVGVFTILSNVMVRDRGLVFRF